MFWFRWKKSRSRLEGAQRFERRQSSDEHDKTVTSSIVKIRTERR
jgi:hypothetical protein